MKKTLIILCGLLFITSMQNVNAQTYPASGYDPSLEKDAYAIVRESSQEFVQQDLNNGTYKVTKAITVLKSNGKEFANFFAYEDAFTELKNFSAQVFDPTGKLVKKVSKKDLSVTGISMDLASDGKYYTYEFFYPSYPYTVKYSYELKFKNGILIYPRFAPVSTFNISVEKANYTLTIPETVQLREKYMTSELTGEHSESMGRTVHKWEVQNFNALPYERFAPRRELFPVVYLSPDEFCAENYCGNMRDWETYGLWLKDLLKDRNHLSQATIDKVHELTNGISDTREKVKVLYEYLQKTTRYVNVSLGIGGWQPLKASEVAKTGFGDCKGLTNYMKSLLEVVNIPSYYTIIGIDQKRFFPEYPSFSQADHVILMVPVENDSIWLECTSQLLPFGYIHSGIVGHDALAVGENKVFFCTLPTYPIEDNIEINRITVNVSPDAHADFTIRSIFKMENFESMFYRFNGLNTKEQINAIGSLLKISKPQISNVNIEKMMTDQPEMALQYEVKCEDYASKTATRLFVPLNPVYTSLKGYFSGSSRTFDIEINSSVNQQDTIVFTFPDDYTLESMPKTTVLESDYGLFRLEVTHNDNTLTAIQTLTLTPGRYPVAEFEQIKDFYNKIENIQSSKISLKKK